MEDITYINYQYLMKIREIAQSEGVEAACVMSGLDMDAVTYLTECPLLMLNAIASKKLFALRLVLPVEYVRSIEKSVLMDSEESANLRLLANALVNKTSKQAAST